MKSRASGKSGTGGKSAKRRKSSTAGSSGAAGASSAFGTALIAGSSKQKVLKSKRAVAAVPKVGKKSTILKRKAKASKNKAPVVKNFVTTQRNNNNHLYYEGYVGNGFTIQMSRFLINGKCYLSLRKPGAVGIVLDCDYFSNLRDAILEIDQGYSEEMGMTEQRTNDVQSLMET